MLSQDSRRPDRSRTGMLRSSSPRTMPWDFRWSSVARSTSASSTCDRSTTPSITPASSVTGKDSTSASSRQPSTVARSASALIAVGRVIKPADLGTRIRGHQVARAHDAEQASAAADHVAVLQQVAGQVALAGRDGLEHLPRQRLRREREEVPHHEAAGRLRRIAHQFPRVRGRLRGQRVENAVEVVVLHLGQDVGPFVVRQGGDDGRRVRHGQPLDQVGRHLVGHVLDELRRRLGGKRDKHRVAFLLVEAEHGPHDVRTRQRRQVAVDGGRVQDDHVLQARHGVSRRFSQPGFHALHR